MPGKGVGYRKDGAVVRARAIRFWWIHTSIHTSSCDLVVINVKSYEMDRTD